MIYYLVTTGYSHTMRTFLEHWGKDLAPRVRIVDYAEALHAAELPVGTYVFADLERLLPAELEIAEIIWDQLHAAGARLLNHPRRTLRRYDLLSRLHALGRNDFRVARATDRSAVYTFPVFIREEGEHSGSLTRILNTQGDVNQALAGAVVRGHRMENLLVVEYCDTVDAHGVFQKYAAFKLGDRVVPAHIDCSRQWLVKDTDIVVEESLQREREYLESNPHREWLEETFAIAGVDYGRMDYGMRGDRPQVWEINTNPVIILNPTNYTGQHMPIKQMLAAMISPALAALDSPLSGVVKIEVPPLLYRRAEAEGRTRRRSRARVQAVRRIKGSRPFRLFRRITHPLLRPLAPLLTRTGSREKQPRSEKIPSSQQEVE
jgi:hypothetical protein